MTFPKQFTLVGHMNTHKLNTCGELGAKEEPSWNRKNPRTAPKDSRVYHCRKKRSFKPRTVFQTPQQQMHNLGESLKKCAIIFIFIVFVRKNNETKRNHIRTHAIQAVTCNLLWQQFILAFFLSTQAYRRKVSNFTNSAMLESTDNARNQRVNISSVLP